MPEIKDIEFSPGNVSMMRKSVKTVLKVGSVMIFSGIALTGYSLFKNSGFELAAVFTLLVTSGAGMISLALGAKALQSKYESEQK